MELAELHEEQMALVLLGMRRSPAQYDHHLRAGEEDKTDEFEAMDVLGVPVQLLFLMSLTILFFSFPLFGVWVLLDEYWIIGFPGRQLQGPARTQRLLAWRWIHVPHQSTEPLAAQLALVFWTFFLRPLVLAATCSVLVCLRSACVDSSGRGLLDFSCIQRYLGRQWTRVRGSSQRPRGFHKFSA